MSSVYQVPLPVATSVYPVYLSVAASIPRAAIIEHYHIRASQNEPEQSNNIRNPRLRYALQGLRWIEAILVKLRLLHQQQLQL
jgi:hypothetical protein